MSQPYLDVTEFIDDPASLEYDGTYYYHPDLYGIIHPLNAKYDFAFLGNYSNFNANSPFPIHQLITLPENGVKTAGLIDDNLLILGNDGALNIFKLGNNLKGEFVDTVSIDNEFISDIINGTFIDISFEPNYGNNGAIFIKDNQEVIFHNIPTPSNIIDLIDDRLIVSAAVNKDKHFCLVFDTGEILYYNGNVTTDTSYDLIPADIINNEDYTSFDINDKQSPNSITKGLEVKAHDGFSLLTFDGNVIVWGGSFQDINNNIGSILKPVATFDIESLSGNGNTYGVAIRENGETVVWGEDTSNRLSNLLNVSDIKNVISLPENILYSVGQGKNIILSNDTLDTDDEALSTLGSYFEFSDIENLMYLNHIAYSTNGYFFAFSEHENESTNPVRVSFKMLKRNNNFYIPTNHFMDYEPANINFEVYSSCNSEYETFGTNTNFSIVDTYYNSDGMADYSKIVVTPIDKDQNGIPDNPLSYKRIVNEDDFIIFESFLDLNGVEATKVSSSTTLISELLYFVPGHIYYADVETSVIDNNGNTNVYEYGKFYKGNSIVDGVIPNSAFELVDDYDADSGKSYSIRNGRAFKTDEPFKFQWTHYSSDGSDRIDPSISSIMDMYVLTNAYDNAVRRWLRSGADPETFPTPPSSEEIRNNIRFIEENKSTSDQVIYIPAEYKLLFGNSARPEHQAEFKIIKLSGATLTDNEIKSRTIDAINNYFDIENWDFGESFYFTELAAYIHNQLIGHVASVVIVPKFSSSSFGDLFQIKCDPNELFLSTANVGNVVITNEYTKQNLRKHR